MSSDIRPTGETFQPSNLSTLLSRLKSRLQELYGPRFIALILYGSYARGDAQPGSDLDVAMVLEDFERPWLEIERTGHIATELSLEYGVTISLIPIRRIDWEQKRTLVAFSLHREGIPVG